MNIMKDNIPVLKDNNRSYMIATDNRGNQVELELDRQAVAKTNPLTGEVTIFKNGEKFKVGYKARKEFSSKRIDPDGGFRAKHEANQETLD